jgi:hypothetical protein
MPKIYAKGEAQLGAACDAIMMLPFEKEFIIDVKENRPKRTNAQNRLMWMWLDDIAKKMSDATGYEVDEIHQLFKDSFLDGKKVKIKGLETSIPSTTELDVKEMGEYLDRIQRFCSIEMGINVPLPVELQRR